MKKLFSRSLLCLSAVLMISNAAHASYGSATSDGNWSSAATWNLGHAPGNNDTLIIPVGYTVTIDINSPTYSNMAVAVFGTLNFDNGMKLNICSGVVVVLEGGQLTGGTPGSKINMCGTTVWNGGTTTPGPLTFGNLNAGGGDYTNTGLNVHTAVAGTHAAATNSFEPRWSSPVVLAGDVFTIERSENGLTYVTVGTVVSAENMIGGHEFSFVDETAPASGCYYRVTQSNNSGYSFTSKNFAAVPKTDPSGCVLNVLPNPCVDQCTVNFTDCPGDNDGVINVEMIDANGTVVTSSVAEQDANGAFSMQVDRSNNLKPGIYIVRGTSSKNVYSQKAVLK